MSDRYGFSEMFASSATTWSLADHLSWDTAETIGVTIVSSMGAYLVRLVLAFLRKKFGAGSTSQR